MVHEKPIDRGGLPKKGELDISDLRGGLAKKKGAVFLRGVDTLNAHYESRANTKTIKIKSHSRT